MRRPLLPDSLRLPRLLMPLLVPAAVALPALSQEPGTALASGLPAAPEVLVPHWKLSLFAMEPEIVTPVGIAVDKKGRIFVLENHTHLVKPDYAGPKSDRVKILEDTDGDGKADKISRFAEGFRAGMNLAFDPDGVLHLVHRNGILRLEDTDGDGVCDRQVPILTLETTETYPHNGLGSLAFTSDGSLYAGSGENFGMPYIAVGTDGTRISYTPGGANIFRMKRDGSGLERFATGLWNAFVLTTDGAGRIFVADNDPDGRPPCRFLHVVKGADFGFDFRYGRSGLHPFVSWNGELPGTLPMMSGTGEAPTGIVDARLAKLGPDRADGFLLTEWGDNTLSWLRLTPHGASFTASRETVIRGPAGFRPACLAQAPDGSVYLTDWADHEYPVHGKGRIWRLHSTAAAQTPDLRPPLPVTEPEKRRDRLASLAAAPDWPELKTALTDPDPFMVNAALTALRQPVFRDALLQEAAARPEPKLHAGLLLALRRQDQPVPEALIANALQSPDATVRRVGMIQAAERRNKSLRPLLEKALEAGGPAQAVPKEDFALWLAAMDLISRDAPPTAATATASNDELLQKLLADPATSPGVKAAVLPMLSNFKAPALIRILITLVSSPDARVRQEAVRSLAFVTVKAAAGPLQKIALNPAEPASLRLEAIGALGSRPTPEVLPVIKLLQDPSLDIRTETVRTLRPHLAEPSVKTALETAAAAVSSPDVAPGPGLDALKSQLALALGTAPPSPRPATLEDWQKTLALPMAGDSAERGRQIFFSAASLCSTCHMAEGRGAATGPALGALAHTAGRPKVIQSILEPSREIAPLYVTKTVTLKDGTIVSGVPDTTANPTAGGDLALRQPGGTVVTVPHAGMLKVEDSPVSLMPEGLVQTLTVQDFRDLLVYLESLP